MNYFEIKDHKLIHYRGKGSSAMIPDRLTDISIPEGVTSIEKSAFALCSGIRSVSIPDSVTVIGQDAFYACKSLERVVIPDSVKHIGSQAFANCRNLRFFKIPEQTRRVDSWAFRGVSASPECYPDGFIIHNHELLQYTGTAREIIIPDSVTKVRDTAFADDSHAETVIIPESVEKFEPYSLDMPELKYILVCGMKFSSRQPYWKLSFQLLRSVWKFLKNPQDAESLNFLQTNRMLLFLLEMEPFRKVLETGKIFTRDVIDQEIRYAIEQQEYEKQLLLTEYKYQHFGFQDIAGNLKL